MPAFHYTLTGKSNDQLSECLSPGARDTSMQFFDVTFQGWPFDPVGRALDLPHWISQATPPKPCP